MERYLISYYRKGVVIEYEYFEGYLEEAHSRAMCVCEYVNYDEYQILIS